MISNAVVCSIAIIRIHCVWRVRACSTEDRDTHFSVRLVTREVEPSVAIDACNARAKVTRSSRVTRLARRSVAVVRVLPVGPPDSVVLCGHLGATVPELCHEGRHIPVVAERERSFDGLNCTTAVVVKHVHEVLGRSNPLDLLFFDAKVADGHRGFSGVHDSNRNVGEDATHGNIAPACNDNHIGARVCRQSTMPHSPNPFARIKSDPFTMGVHTTLISLNEYSPLGWSSPTNKILGYTRSATLRIYFDFRGFKKYCMPRTPAIARTERHG